MSESPAPETPSSMSGRHLRDLKSRAQHLDPVVKIGKAGLSDGFYAALNLALDQHELVKFKFDDLKDQKKELVPQIVSRTGSQLIQRVGNVAVVYRRRKTTPVDDAAE